MLPQTLNPFSPFSSRPGHQAPAAHPDPRDPDTPDPDPVVDAQRRPCSVLAVTAVPYAPSPRLPDREPPTSVPTQLASADRRGTPSPVAAAPLQVAVSRRPLPHLTVVACRPSPPRCHHAMEMELEGEVAIPSLPDLLRPRLQCQRST